MLREDSVVPTTTAAAEAEAVATTAAAVATTTAAAATTNGFNDGVQQQQRGRRRRREGIGRATRGRGESLALESILRESSLSIPQFFDEIWQRSCGIFRYNDDCDYGKRQSAEKKGKYDDDGTHGAPTTTVASGSYSTDDVSVDPRAYLVERGWDVLVQVLERATRERQQQRQQQSDVVVPSSTGPEQEEESDEEQQRARYNAVAAATSPVLFKDRKVVSRFEVDRLYGQGGGSTNYFAAYLDGCSVVFNHADRVHGAVALLCDDLQRSFPFAYANAYLTPPMRQTAPPHADDRDVLVVQVVGRKRWTVYRSIPVPYPYADEQVGKDGYHVPEEVLNGPVLIDAVLNPGDVLYMPRGYVHEAQCCCNSTAAVDGDAALEPSFHITVALATHDWTLAGLMSKASQQIWSNVVDFRMALPREVGTELGSNAVISTENGNDDAMRDDGGGGGDDDDDGISNDFGESRKLVDAQLQSQIDRAIEMLRSQFTPQSVREAMSRKYELHKSRVSDLRKSIIERDVIVSATKRTDDGASARRKQPQNGVPPIAAAVGREASERVSLDTRIRLATDEEKAGVAARRTATEQQQPVGLHVFETNYAVIMSILQAFKSDASLKARVGDLLQLVQLQDKGEGGRLGGSIGDDNRHLCCMLTLLSFARQCVELGALAIAQD